jgi:hypothetical protein
MSIDHMREILNSNIKVAVWGCLGCGSLLGNVFGCTALLNHLKNGQFNNTSF